MFVKWSITDDFLTADEARAWLAFAIANEAGFVPSKVTTSENAKALNAHLRNSLQFRGSLGDLGTAFERAILARLNDLMAASGLAAFADPVIELDLAAHRNGGYFRPHVDTLTDGLRQFDETDRVLSAVYYFFAQPAQFSGGQLEMHPLHGDAGPRQIEPRHNRLVSFPSIAPHAVTPLSLPSDNFRDARFSINCWVRRRRANKGRV